MQVGKRAELNRTHSHTGRTAKHTEAATGNATAIQPPRRDPHAAVDHSTASAQQEQKTFSLKLQRTQLRSSTLTELTSLCYDNDSSGRQHSVSPAGRLHRHTTHDTAHTLTTDTTHSIASTRTVLPAAHSVTPHARRASLPRIVHQLSLVSLPTPYSVHHTLWIAASTRHPDPPAAVTLSRRPRSLHSDSTSFQFTSAHQ